MTTDHGQKAIDRFKVMLNGVTLNTITLTKLDEQIDALQKADVLTNADGVDSRFIFNQLTNRRDAIYESVDDSRYQVCLALQTIPATARQEIAAIVARYQSDNASPSGVA